MVSNSKGNKLMKISSNSARVEVDGGEEYVKFKDVMRNMVALFKTLLGTKQMVVREKSKG